MLNGYDFIIEGTFGVDQKIVATINDSESHTVEIRDLVLPEDIGERFWVARAELIKAGVIANDPTELFNL